MVKDISNLFKAIDIVAAEKGITPEYVSSLLKESIEKAYSKEFPGVRVDARINLAKKTINLYEIKTIVEKSEDEIDDDLEINLSEAITFNKNAKLGDELEIDIDIDGLERVIASHIKQIFQQKINEITNIKIYEKWKDKANLVVYAEVEKEDTSKKIVEVKLQDDFGIVNRADQIPGEKLSPGSKYYFLIKEVKQQSKSWPIVLSRTSPLLVQSLLANHIPEIQQGIIKMELAARVAGFKTKIAVSCTDDNIDPVGTCIGKGGERIKNISKHVNNEMIDIFAYDSDPKQLIINMCGNEKVVGLEITDDPTEINPNNKIVTIVCDEGSVEKLIGKSGVNVKLMSNLTGWSIDIVSLKTAIEDQIEYEDVSHMTPTKFLSYLKRQRSNNFSNDSVIERSDDRKKFKPFSSTAQSYDSFDYNFDDGDNWGSKVTEEDVENLLSSTNVRKRKVEDDEEVIFVTSKSEENNQELEENNNFESNESNIKIYSRKSNKNSKDITEEFFSDSPSINVENQTKSIKTTKIEKSKETKSIDEFFDDYQEAPSAKKKTKTTKPKANKFSDNQEKKEKKKVNVLEEFDISEDDFDDSNNIDLDDIDFDDYEE